MHCLSNHTITTKYKTKNLLTEGILKYEFNKGCLEDVPVEHIYFKYFSSIIIAKIQYRRSWQELTSLYFRRPVYSYSSFQFIINY